MCSTMVVAVGGWRLAAVGGWQLATGGWWRLVVVGGGWWLAVGGWRQLAVVGSWRLVAAGGWRRLVAGSWWRLVVGGWWRLAVDGSWRLAVGGPLGLSLRAVLSKKKKKSRSLRTPLAATLGKSLNQCHRCAASPTLPTVHLKAQAHHLTAWAQQLKLWGHNLKACAHHFTARAHHFKALAHHLKAWPHRGSKRENCWGGMVMGESGISAPQPTNTACFLRPLVSKYRLGWKPFPVSVCVQHPPATSVSVHSPETSTRAPRRCLPADQRERGALRMPKMHCHAGRQGKGQQLAGSQRQPVVSRHTWAVIASRWCLTGNPRRSSINRRPGGSPPEPTITLVMVPRPPVRGTVNDQKLTEPTPSVAWTRALLARYTVHGTCGKTLHSFENQGAHYPGGGEI